MEKTGVLSVTLSLEIGILSKASDPIRVAKLLTLFPHYLLSRNAKQLAITLELHRQRGKAYPQLLDCVWLGERELRNLNTPDNENPAAKVTPDQRRRIKTAMAELIEVGYVELQVKMAKLKPWTGLRTVYKLAPLPDINIHYNQIKKPAIWPSGVVANRAAKVKHEALIVESQMNAIVSEKAVWPALPLWDMPKLQTELRARTMGAADGYLKGGISVFADTTGRTIDNTMTLAGSDNSGLNLIHVAKLETHSMGRVKPYAIAQMGSDATEQMMLLMIWLYGIPLPKETKHLPPLTVFDVKVWAALLDVHPKTIRKTIKKLQERGLIFVAKDGRGAQAMGVLTRAIPCTPSAVNDQSIASDRGKLDSALAHVDLDHKFAYNPNDGLGFEKPKVMRDFYIAEYNLITMELIAIKAKAKHQANMLQLKLKKTTAVLQLDGLKDAISKLSNTMTTAFKPDTFKILADKAKQAAKLTEPERRYGLSPEAKLWLDTL